MVVYTFLYMPGTTLPWVHPAYTTPTLLHAEAGNGDAGVLGGSPGL